MKKAVLIKMVTNDILKVEMKQDLPNDEIYAELLNGKKEFCLAGGVAIAKEHIVYVMIQEEQNEQNTDDKRDDQQAASGIEETAGYSGVDRPPCDSDC